MVLVCLYTCFTVYLRQRRGGDQRGGEEQLQQEQRDGQHLERKRRRDVMRQEKGEEKMGRGARKGQ